MILVIKKKKIIIGILLMISIIIVIGIYRHSKKSNDLILGGNLIKENMDIDSVTVFTEEISVEKYFRPSKFSVLNDNREIGKVITDNYKNVIIPNKYISNPEDTIINYFSILREAANPVKGKFTGCGSIGVGKSPYPIAYNFFDNEYKENISYEKYEDSFKNILHINLIKVKKIPEYSDEEMKYFYEIETIQGSETGVGYFAYYYGYITLIKENDSYKISCITVTPEEYLCAPYHSWFYSGEYSLEIKYGYWCNLVKKVKGIEVEGYVKDIIFEGTDGNEYKIEFFTLTNDYDIEIAQFKKNNLNQWERIYINPEDCLKNK